MYVDVIGRAMHKFGTVQQITDEEWSNAYRYKVGNRTRLVMVDLNKHIPSQLFIDAYRALISYAGQPVTCYVCNEADHLAQECSRRSHQQTAEHTWARLEELGGRGVDNDTHSATAAPASLTHAPRTSFETTDEQTPKRKYDSYTSDHIAVQEQDQHTAGHTAQCNDST
jgi:hypothetical protein